MDELFLCIRRGVRHWQVVVRKSGICIPFLYAV